MSYFQAARSFWADAGQVRLRAIGPKLLGQDGVREVYAQ